MKQGPINWIARTLFQALLVFIPIGFLSAAKLSPSVCAQMLKLMHNQIAGDAVDYYRDILAVEPSTKATFSELEDWIINHFFWVAPEYRDRNEFATRFGLTPEQARDVEIYYAEVIGDGAYELVDKDPLVAINRLREINRAAFVEENINTDLIARRLPFYQMQVTKLSVPEIAAQLGISEREIYRDLSILELSIIEAFRKNGKLDEAASRVRGGEPVELIAKDLDFGEQALRFVLHGTSIVNRGVEWDRILVFENRLYSEAALLEELWLRQTKPAEIASIINQITHETPPSPGVRTEASVNAKMSELGFTKPQLRGASEVYDPQYGFIKRRGALMLWPVLRYLADHREFPEEIWAEKLDVSMPSLREFLKKHHLDAVFIRNSNKVSHPKIKVETRERLSKYVLQKKVLQAEVDLMVQKFGKAPEYGDYGSGPGKIPFPYARVNGNASYEHSPLAIFPDRFTHYRSLELEAAKRGIVFPWSSLTFPNTTIPDDVKAKIRLHALAVEVEAMKKNPVSILDAHSYGNEKDQIPINYYRLNGFGSYRRGQSNSKSAIFSDRASHVLSLEKAAKEQGVTFPWIDTTFRSDSRDNLIPRIIQSRIRNHALSLEIDWMKSHLGRVPDNTDYGKGPGKIHIPYLRVNGVDVYGPEGVQRGAAIFPNRISHLLNLEAECKRNGLRMPWTSVRFAAQHFEDRKIPTMIQKKIKSDALEIEVAWMKKHRGEVPSKKNYGIGPDLIPIKFARLNGQGIYGPNGKARHLGIFPDRSAHLLALAEAVSKHGINFPWASIRFFPSKFADGKIPKEIAEKIARSSK